MRMRVYFEAVCLACVSHRKRFLVSRSPMVVTFLGHAAVTDILAPCCATRNISQNFFRGRDSIKDEHSGWEGRGLEFLRWSRENRRYVYSVVRFLITFIRDAINTVCIKDSYCVNTTFHFQFFFGLSNSVFQRSGCENEFQRWFPWYFLFLLFFLSIYYNFMKLKKNWSICNVTIALVFNGLNGVSLLHSGYDRTIIQ